MSSYKPTENAQDIKFSFELYGGSASFSLTIPASELSVYSLGTQVLIGDKYIGEVTKRTKSDDYTYLIEGDGYKGRLSGIIFKGKYNVYDEENNLLPGAIAINDIGDILDDVIDYITPLGLTFDGLPPYVTTGIAPWNCNLSCSVADIITHIAQAAGKGWYINQQQKIVFCDIVKYGGQEFAQEICNDIVNILIIKGNLKPAYTDSTSEVEKYKYFTTITDNSGLFCPPGYVGATWESQQTRFESPSKIFIFADADSIAIYGRKEAQLDVPYLDTNSEASDFAAEYFLNNAVPIRTNTSFTIGEPEKYPYEKGAKKTYCRLLPTGQVRADYYYYGVDDSLYNTEFIKGVKDNNKEKLINELDTTPPKVTLIRTESSIYKKSYKKVKNPLYLASYAKDDTAISEVKFYLSKWNGSVWTAYSLIGSGVWQDPPDADSEGYYEYSEDDGYYDLITDGGLVRGDIFRIKTVAKDRAGNVGEDVDEYQLEFANTDMTVTILTNESEPTNAPTVHDVVAGTHFKLKVMFDDMSVTANPVVTYRNSSGELYDLTYGWDVDEHVVYVSSFEAPALGEMRELTVAVTNVFGNVTKRHYYIRGIQMPAMGVPITVRDSSTTASETTASVPQFKDNIYFESSFKDQFYYVTLADVKFRIYDTSDNNVKTLTSVSTPAIVYGGNTDKFKCDTTVAALGLSDGLYSIACELTKHEKFIDESGTIRTGNSSAVEGDRVQFQIAALTWRDRINSTDGIVSGHTTTLADHEDRLPAAEQESNFTWSSGTKTAQVKFFATDVPDSGSPGWFFTDDKLAGTPVYTRLNDTNITGVNGDTFTIEQDSSSGQYKYLVFDSNNGTNKGKLRYDVTNAKFEISVDNGTNWTDLATGISTAIQNTSSGTLYKLRIASTDGSLSFIEDPLGTNLTLFTVDVNGNLTVNGGITATGNIAPSADELYDLGTATEKFVNTYTQNIVLGDGTANLTWDSGNGIIIPENIALGFW